MRVAVVVLVMLVGTSAHALMQPDGTVIPENLCTGVSCTPGPNDENCIGEILSCAGESISDPVAAAEVDPQTFVPRGPVQIDLLSKNSANQCRFGWYNADDTNPSPTLYPFVEACVDRENLGSLITFNWCNDPRWTGGRVGLFLGCYRIPFDCERSEECVPGNENYCHVFYSETQRNTDNNAAGWIYGIRYSSGVTPGRYYLAWEDWFGNAGNDFNDFVFAVTGVDRGCKIGTDCPDGYTCDGQRCVPSTTCTNDNDCFGGLTCNMDTGLCALPPSSCGAGMDAGVSPGMDASVATPDAAQTSSSAPASGSSSSSAAASSSSSSGGMTSSGGTDGGHTVGRSDASVGGGGVDAGEDGTPAGSCGCQVSSERGSPLALLLVALLGLARGRTRLRQR